MINLLTSNKVANFKANLLAVFTVCLVFFLVLLASAAFAASALPAAPGVPGDSVLSLGAAAALALLELVIRLKPTVKDYSLINLLFRLLNLLVPNRAVNETGETGIFKAATNAKFNLNPFKR